MNGFPKSSITRQQYFNALRIVEEIGSVIEARESYPFKEDRAYQVIL